MSIRILGNCEGLQSSMTSSAERLFLHPYQLVLLVLSLYLLSDTVVYSGIMKSPTNALNLSILEDITTMAFATTLSLFLFLKNGEEHESTWLSSILQGYYKTDYDDNDIMRGILFALIVKVALKQIWNLTSSATASAGKKTHEKKIYCYDDSGIEHKYVGLNPKRYDIQDAIDKESSSAAADSDYNKKASDPMLWLIHGTEYDLNDFVDRHPGGKESILLGRGRDCSAMFDSYHAFTNQHRYVIASS